MIYCGGSVHMLLLVVHWLFMLKIVSSNEATNDLEVSENNVKQNC